MSDPHAIVVVHSEARTPSAEHLSQTLEVDGETIELSHQRVTENQVVEGERVLRVPLGNRHVTLSGRYYQVMADSDGKTSTLTHDSCEASNGYQFREGHTYKFHYAFRGTHNCSLTCTDVTDRGVPCAHAGDAPTVPRPMVATPTPAPSRRRPLAPLGTAAIVLGSVGVTLGVVTGVVATVHKDYVIESCGRAAPCNPETVARGQDANNAADISSTAFGVGGGLVLGGIAVLLFGPAQEAPKPSVAFDKNGATVGLQGTF